MVDRFEGPGFDQVEDRCREHYEEELDERDQSWAYWRHAYRYGFVYAVDERFHDLSFEEASETLMKDVRGHYGRDGWTEHIDAVRFGYELGQEMVED
jgi:hypothetical protein